jgi:hypothetical protein
MPCNDVTEIIQVSLDAEDRLTKYLFAKQSCGRGVGHASWLLEELSGRSAGEILSLGPDDIQRETGIEDFLRQKHLMAVQGALAVLTGEASGGVSDWCAPLEIVRDGGETLIRARIWVDILTERIAACGGRAGCGCKSRRVPAV